MHRIALVIALCAAGPSALAVGPNIHSPMPQDTSSVRYASDLVGSDSARQTYAARVLLRRVKTAWRVASREGDGLEIMEARQTLSEFDLIVAPRCLRMLSSANTAKPCIRILGMLETEEALNPLRQQLDSAGWWKARLLKRSIGQIEGTP